MFRGAVVRCVFLYILPARPLSSPKPRELPIVRVSIPLGGADDRFTLRPPEDPLLTAPPLAGRGHDGSPGMCAGDLEASLEAGSPVSSGRFVVDGAPSRGAGTRRVAGDVCG